MKSQKRMQITVQIYYLSAEKLWEFSKPLPSNVHISANVSVTGLEKSERGLVLPFVVSISYNPSVAQISLKGRAIVTGKEEELKKIEEGYNKRLPPPPSVLQSITTASLAEAVILSKSIGVPPPLPVPGPPPAQKQEKGGLYYIS